MAETSESEMRMSAPEEVINAGAAAANMSVPNPTSPSSLSDSDSDDSDSESEGQLILQLQNLEAEVSNNPSNYDAHVKYIKCLRKQGHIDKLRQAREAMSELFPLSSVMWQEWTKDEVSLASSRPDAYCAIEKLYERGVFEYLSVSLWCDYLNFIQEYDPLVRDRSPDGISKARNLFERAVTAAGLHVVEGSKIWESYRQFEQAIFHTIPESDVEAKEKQVQRIRSIFHRQLSVPLVDLSLTLLTYKAWEVEQGNVFDVNSTKLDGIASHVATAYQKALEMYNARAHFEDQITKEGTTDSDKLQQFMSYLKYEESSGDPTRVHILYERAIAEFPISTDIWLDYIRNLDRTLKVGNVVRDVYSRATKNCPWVGELWVRHLLSLERGHASEKDVSAVFEKSLQCTFSSFEERASDYLSPNLKNTDSLLRLHAYWARLELNLGKDLTAARGVWESLVKMSGSMLEAWKGYIAMEIEAGNISEARSIYRRCYSKRFNGMGSEDICHSWLRFEREYGALEDFDHAERKVTPRLDELQLFRLQQEPKAIAASDQKGNLLKKHPYEKRKASSNTTDEQPLAKRRKNTSQNPKNVSGKDKTQAHNSVEANEVEECDTNVGNADSTSGQQSKDAMPEKTPIYTDQCTAFISNLNFQATYEHIRNFFSDVGGVVAIRILTEKYSGKSRGLAYVDFSDDAHLAAAVAKNKQVLLGKKLSIVRSAPNQRKSKGSSLGHGKRAGHASDRRESDSKAVERSEYIAPKAPSSATSRGNSTMQLEGKNTFAVPRAVKPFVKPLGWTQGKPRTEEGGDDQPKSNDDFRKMFNKS
ncbi:uncharacterized protein LOC131164571 isoform X2 [Malania oleifera]|uniref:uncharacterized protein LOC131164571 isoform X2 n=1 Tax=Malania oleifera TaxID=397392 RepID=UPI0025AE0D63|nr:uncharacterized protein LOC131164571 isoform X2 [Malania oleifera]